jgi:hypothetical protein
VFHAVGEQAADLIERVVLVPASAQSVLLDAAADFVDDLGFEPDDVKGVKEGDRLGQPVMMAFAYPRNGSSAACSTPSTNPSGWAFSQLL